MIKASPPTLDGAFESLGLVMDMVTDEIRDNAEDSNVVAKLLGARVYLELIREWLECSDEIESKNSGEVLQEIYEGWVYYGD